MTNEKFLQTAKELISENFPVYEGEIAVTNDDELLALLTFIQTNYEKMVDELMEKIKDEVIKYVELESPYKEQTKRKAQNDYVLSAFRNRLLNYKKPTKETVYSCLWSFRQKNTDTSNFYD